jgi:hypothetical protein
MTGSILPTHLPYAPAPTWQNTPQEPIATAEDALARANQENGGSVLGDTHEQTLGNLEASRETALAGAEAADVNAINHAYDLARTQLDVNDVIHRAGEEADSYQKGVILEELEGLLEPLSAAEKQQLFEGLGAESVRDLGAQLASVWQDGPNASVPSSQDGYYTGEGLFYELAEGMSMHRLASLTIGLQSEADAAAGYLGRVIGEQGGQRAVDYVEQIATWTPGEDAVEHPSQYATAIAETLAQLKGADYETAIAALDADRLDAVLSAGQDLYPNGGYGSTLTEQIIATAVESGDPVLQAQVFRSAGESLAHLLEEPGDHGSQIINTRNAMVDLLLADPNGILNELRPTEQNSSAGSTGMDNAGRSLVALNQALLIDSNELNYNNDGDAANVQQVGHLISQISAQGQTGDVPGAQVAANLGFFTGAASNALENSNILKREAGDDVLVNLAVGLVGEIPYPGAEVATTVIDEVRGNIRQDQLDAAQTGNQELAETFVDLALEQVPTTPDRSDANTEKFNEYFAFTRSTQLGQ